MPRRPDLHTIYLIARREFTTRVRSRFFIFGTVLFAVLLAGYIVLQAVVISRVTTTVKIGFSGDAQTLAEPLKTVAATESGIPRQHFSLLMKRYLGREDSGSS